MDVRRHQRFAGTNKTFTKLYHENEYKYVTSIHQRLAVASLVLWPVATNGDPFPNTIDDFSDSGNTSLGLPRMVIDDTTAGGQSSSKQMVNDGVMTSEGVIAPPRGQPGWVSMIFPLRADGSPADISAYEGIRIRMRIKEGMVSVSANSSEIDNFDYHAALVDAAGGKEIQEVRIPFSSMRRAWSPQTKLNTATIASVSLVAVGIQKSAFGFEIDEIGFY